MAEPKRTIKDSIFTFLFGEPEYTMELYQTLHPEDTTVKDSDVKLVTLQNVQGLCGGTQTFPLSREKGVNPTA